MGDTRIRYGLAYGRMNNFVTGSTDQTTRGYLAGTDGLFKQADTTPDVTNGFLFYTNNSSATTISDFQFQHPAMAGSTQVAGLFEGKAIKILFIDSNTTVSGAGIYLANSADTFSQNSVLDLIYHNSAWYETSRSMVIPPTGVKTVTVASTHSLTINDNDSVLIVTGTTAVNLCQSFSGGYVGQRIVVVSGSGGASLKFSNTGSSGLGNIYFTSTADFVIGSGESSASVNCVEFVKVSPTAWSIPNTITP